MDHELEQGRFLIIRDESLLGDEPREGYLTFDEGEI